MLALYVTVVYVHQSRAFTVTAARDKARGDISVTVLGEDDIPLHRDTVAGKSTAFGSGICRAVFEAYLRSTRNQPPRTRVNGEPVISPAPLKLHIASEDGK